MYTIIVTDLYADDPVAGTSSYQIQKDAVTIGRSRENDIVIRQTNVSTKHISITHTGRGFVLRDLNSTNGTKVNKQPLTGEIQVFSDDQIQIGGSLIRLTSHPDLERGGRESVMTDDDDGFADDGGLDQGDLGGGGDLDDLFPQAVGEGGLPPAAPGPGSDLSLSAIAPIAGSGRPSILLDDIFPYQDSKILDSNEQSSQDNFNPFPLDDLDAAPAPNAPPKNALLDKIARLESKVMKNTDPPQAKQRPRGVHIGNGSVLLPPSSKRREAARAATPHQQDLWPETGAAIPAPGQTAFGAPLDDPFADLPMENEAFEIVVSTRNVNAKNQKKAAASYPKSRLVIGRNPDCDISLQSSYISGRHAEIEIENGLLVVRDLGSTNGTYLNGAEIKEATFIDPEDEVKLGEFLVSARLQRLSGPAPDPAGDPVGAASAGSPFPDETGGAPFPSIISSPGAGSQVSAVHTAPQRQAAATAPRGMDQRMLEGNFNALSMQLHIARKTIGKALDELQNYGYEPYDIREVCEELAKAVKLLYRSSDLENDFELIQGVVDSVLAHLAGVMSVAHQSFGHEVALGDLQRAHALLLPLSRQGLAAFASLGAVPGIAILAEMGYLGIQQKSVSVTAADLLRDSADIDGALIAGARFTNSLEYLACARSLARTVADILYFDLDDRARLENVVDEACTNVIEHAFDTQGSDSFFLSFLVVADERLAIVVDDLGLPLNTHAAERGSLDGLGFKLIRAFCDEVHFINRGRRGKRLLMLKGFPAQHGNTMFRSIIQNKNNALITDAAKCEVRMASAEHAEPIARCVYRAHRYGYFDDTLYRAEELLAQIQSGRRVAAVALNQNNVVVGFMSVALDSGASRSGTLGNAVVVPQMNTANTASKLTTFLTDACRNRGMAGLHVVMTTAHPYEQIAFASLGAVYTGVQLGHLPGAQNAADAASVGPRRQTAAMAYLKLNDARPQQVYLPARYAAVLREIYAKTGIHRQLHQPESAPGGALPAISNVRVAESRSLGHAVIEILEIGDDIAAVLRSQVAALQRESCHCIYLDIPLASPAVDHLVRQLERSRVCFAGLVPETDHGDMLRLQTLNLDVDMSAIHIEGAFGKSLLQFIVKERAGLIGLF